MTTSTIDSVVALREIEAFIRPEADGKQARTRERILGAATDLFVAHGYRKTSVEDVAWAAGVAKGTVYLYYRNKAEMLMHAIALQKLEYLEKLAPVFDSTVAAPDRLRSMIQIGILMSHQLPLIHQSTSGDHEIELALAEVDQQTLTQINQQQIDYLAAMIEAASERSWTPTELRKRAEVLVDLIFAVVNGGRLIRDGMALEEYAATLADMIVDGVVNAPSRPGR